MLKHTTEELITLSRIYEVEEEILDLCEEMRFTIDVREKRMQYDALMGGLKFSYNSRWEERHVYFDYVLLLRLETAKNLFKGLLTKEKEGGLPGLQWPPL